MTESPTKRRPDRNAVVTLDRPTRRLLTAIAVLLSMLIVELWVLQPCAAPQAQAQIPDTGLQRQQIVEEQRRSNDLLSAILNHLRTKSVNVKVETTEKPGNASKRASRP